MSSDDWWSPANRDVMAQGDIFSGVCFTESLEEAQPLVSAQVRGGSQGWVAHPVAKYDHNDCAPHLSLARRAHHGIVMTHTDDLLQGMFALVAPLFPISAVSSDRADYVRAQLSVPMFYLPGVPTFGDAFADLRFATRVPVGMLKSDCKIATASEPAQKRFRAQLLGFFVRKLVP